jgi:hypothetical protein
MSKEKQSRKEILEIDARLKELERTRGYINTDFLKARTEQLTERKDKLQDRLDKKEIAPDIQYIVFEEGEEEVDFEKL